MLHATQSHTQTSRQVAASAHGSKLAGLKLLVSDNEGTLRILLFWALRGDPLFGKKPLSDVRRSQPVGLKHGGSCLWIPELQSPLYSHGSQKLHCYLPVRSHTCHIFNGALELLKLETSTVAVVVSNACSHTFRVSEIESIFLQSRASAPSPQGAALRHPETCET